MSGKIIHFDQETWRLDQVLSRRRRVRRSHSFQGTFQREILLAHDCPYSLRDIPDPFEVCYRRGGWRALDVDERNARDDDAGPQILRRETVAWLWEDFERVGAVKVAEYQFGLPSDDEIFRALDRESGAQGELAVVLTSAWPDFSVNVAIFGGVVEIESVWLLPGRARREAGEMMLHAMLEKHLPRACLLVLKTFPLEYAGLAPDGSAASLGLIRRWRAMMKVAGRHLGARPFPGADGSHGWMWAMRPDLEIEPPKARRK